MEETWMGVNEKDLDIDRFRVHLISGIYTQSFTLYNAFILFKMVSGEIRRQCAQGD
jgi:hypothetical protein